jgi:hypothetical protein
VLIGGSVVVGLLSSPQETKRTTNTASITKIAVIFFIALPPYQKK